MVVARGGLDEQLRRRSRRPMPLYNVNRPLAASGARDGNTRAALECLSRWKEKLPVG